MAAHTNSGSRVGEVERITPNSHSSRGIRRLRMKHETANLSRLSQSGPERHQILRSMISVRSTATTSGILRTYVSVMHMANRNICLSMTAKNEAPSSPAFRRFYRTELAFGSVLTDRWRRIPTSSLPHFLHSKPWAAHPVRHERSIPRLLAITMPSRRTPRMTIARKRSFDSQANLR